MDEATRNAIGAALSTRSYQGTPDELDRILGARSEDYAGEQLDRFLRVNGLSDDLKKRASSGLRDIRLWKDVQTSGSNPLALAEYLTQFPKAQPGRHTKEAFEKLVELNDDQAWNAALQEDQTLSYKEYQKKYPNGRHVEEAKQKIELAESAALEEHRNSLYARATESRDVDAMKEFLERYAPDKKAPEVRQLLRETELQTSYSEIAASDDVQARRTFVEDYPDTTYAEQIGRLIEPDDWKQAQEKDTLDSYAKYLILHPKSKNAEAARSRRDLEARKKDVAVTVQFPGGVTCDLDMVYVPAGSFIWPSEPNVYSPDYNDDKPRVVSKMASQSKHRVVLSGFWISRYEVRQELYEHIMSSNPSPRNFSDNLQAHHGLYPVHPVRWNEAWAFCQRLAEHTGGAWTLPTQWQWEYAARADGEGFWCFGSDVARLAEFAVYDCQLPGTSDHMWEWFLGARSSSKDVAQYFDYLDRRPNVRGGRIYPLKPNAWGVRDMHGMLTEWCLDALDENMYKNAPSVLIDPQGPQADSRKSSERSLRGGSYRSPPGLTGSGVMYALSSDESFWDVGFRVVCGDISGNKQNVGLRSGSGQRVGLSSDNSSKEATRGNNETFGSVGGRTSEYGSESRSQRQKPQSDRQRPEEPQKHENQHQLQRQVEQQLNDYGRRQIQRFLH